jgi:hypothetical protein
MEPPAPAPKPDDWLARSVKIVDWIILWYLFGPVPYQGYTLRRKLAREGDIWHAERRWTQHTSVALAWPLLYWAILAYFRVPVVVIWGAVFSTIAGWIHIPAFALLGNASLFPPTPGNLLFRWLICAPLAPLIARVLEELQPQTQYTVKRVVTPEEQQAHIAIEQEEAAERKAIADAEKAERARIKAIKAARAPKTSKKPPTAQASGPHIPPATSLWGSIDWANVSNNDPAKQLMLAELSKLSPAQLADVRREQRMAQGKPVTSGPAPASPIVNPAPLPETTAQKQDSDEYDWGAGDGTVSF